MKETKIFILFFILFLFLNNADASQYQSEKITKQLSKYNSDKDDKCKRNINYCDIQVSFDYEVQGLTVIFKGDFNENYIEVTWDFGDGKNKTLSSEELKKGESISHTYEKTDVYTFSYTAVLSRDETKECNNRKYEGRIYAFNFND